MLAFSLLAVAGELISAFAGTGGGIGVSLRVVDEVAPAGGLALVRVELTEPKPISGGKIRVSVGRAVALARRAAAAAGPLGVIQAVGILSRSGDVQGTATLGETATTIDFTSPRSTYGTDLDLPLIVIAVPVSAAATLGQTANLSVDLSGTQFLDPGGQPYPVEVKQGTFGVGGVSVSRLVAPSDNPAPGTTIILEGVGFQAGARVAIEGADLSSRVVSPQRIEVTTGAQVSLADVAIRLRNPDGSDDMFYAIKELRDTSQGTAAALRFATEAPARIAGTAEDVVLSLPQAASQAGTASISRTMGLGLVIPCALRASLSVRLMYCSSVIGPYYRESGPYFISNLPIVFVILLINTGHNILLILSPDLHRDFRGILPHDHRIHPL